MKFFADRRQADIPGLVALWGSGATVATGVLGLAGWAMHAWVFTGAMVSYIPIAPSTCLAFLVQGAALLGRIHGPSRNRARLFMAPAAASSLFGLLAFMEIFTGLDLTFERKIFFLSEHLGSFPTNVMSPFTGLLFCLSGGALMLLLGCDASGRSVRRLIGVMAGLVAMTGLTGAIGYVYGTPFLYGGQVIPVALTTYLGFMFLGAGLLASAGPDGFLLKPLNGSSVRAVLLRNFIPLAFIAVLTSDLLQHLVTKLNSAIVSAASVVFSGILAVFFVFHVARLIGATIEAADAKRKEAEAMVRREKEDWEDTFNSVPDLITILDCTHRVVRVNRAMADRLGLTPEQCVGARCHEVVHGTALPPVFCPHDLTCNDGLEHVVEVHEPRLGGDFIVSTTPKFDAQGRIAGSVHVARDITERKAIEEERENLILKLREALSQVKLLSGFLPICASCKKIRDDKGYWQQIELYIRDHSEAEFSHGICPDCAKKLYPDLYEDSPD